MDAQVRGSTQVWGTGAVRVLDYPTERAASEEIKALIAAVEVLLPRIHAAADSEVARLRKSARQALDAAQAAVASRAAPLRRNGRERPWAAVGLAALAAFTFGIWAGRSVAERR